MRTSELKRRKIHLVDLENLVGGGRVTESITRRVRAAYLSTGFVAAGDHVVVGISHNNLLAAGYGWADARCVVRSGLEGADLALQEVMATENLHQRFGSGILVTGDGGFAYPVAALINLGLPVGVIAPKGRLPVSLKLAASASCEIDFIAATYASWSA
jgi:hypothetical protein